MSVVFRSFGEKNRPYHATEKKGLTHETVQTHIIFVSDWRGVGRTKRDEERHVVFSQILPLISYAPSLVQQNGDISTDSRRVILTEPRLCYLIEKWCEKMEF